VSMLKYCSFCWQRVSIAIHKGNTICKKCAIAQGLCPPKEKIHIDPPTPAPNTATKTEKIQVLPDKVEPVKKEATVSAVEGESVVNIDELVKDDGEESEYQKLAKKKNLDALTN